LRRGSVVVVKVVSLVVPENMVVAHVVVQLVDHMVPQRSCVVVVLLNADVTVVIAITTDAATVLVVTALSAVPSSSSSRVFFCLSPNARPKNGMVGVPGRRRQAGCKTTFTD
jgi:hypothetical protein